ncbi:MAG: SDR family NAD(P)-dependent oxidoreductase [Sneathiella sp.]
MTRSDLEKDPWLAIGALLEKSAEARDDKTSLPLSDKHILIAGGDKGIGAHVTRSLAVLGAKVSLISDDPICVAFVREKIHLSTEIEIHDYVTDFTNEDQTGQAIEWATNLLGAPYSLINAIDLPCSAPFGEIPASDIQTVLSTNLLGPANTIRGSLAGFKENGSGIVINIAAAIALNGGANQSIYAASKAGLVALGQSLNAELSAQDISVYSLCPGITLTADLEKTLASIAEQQNIPFESLLEQVSKANNQPFLINPKNVTVVIEEILTGSTRYKDNPTISNFD